MTNGTTTIPALREQLEQELQALDQQIAVAEQQLRTAREQAAFVRGQLDILGKIVAPPIMSGAALGEQEA